MKRGWQHHETYVAGVLGLDTTLASGALFHDPGDAVTRGHSPFPLYADCKYTVHHSFSIKDRQLRQYAHRAAELGRRLILPIRFWPYEEHDPQDWVVISLHDLRELMDLIPQDKEVI